MTLRTRRARHGGSWQKPQHLGDGHRRTRASRSFLIFDYIAVPKPLSKNRIRHKITSCPRLKSAGNSLIPSQGRGVSRAPWSCFPTFSVLITRHSDFGVQSPEPFVVTLSILPPSFPRSALLFPVLFPPPPSPSLYALLGISPPFLPPLLCRPEANLGCCSSGTVDLVF